MSQLSVDRSVADVLRQSKGRTEIHDPDGTLIGIYEPIVDGLLEFARKNFDLERARRIVAEEGGRGTPTAEMLKRLGATESAS